MVQPMTGLTVSRTQDYRAQHADTKQGQHLCDERIANLWQIIQQLCQQEHTRRQSGQELSVNIPRAIHAIQEEIGTLQEINQTVASWQKGKSLTCT